MSLDAYELIAIATAISAIFMLGTRLVRVNLWFYALHTILLVCETCWIAAHGGEAHLYIAAIAICTLKAIFIPLFLGWIVKHIGVQNDQGTFLPPPVAMNLAILLYGFCFLLAYQLPELAHDNDAKVGAASSFSLLLTGVMLMLTRKIAVSQIMGFLVIENGIYLFALTQTHGMPMIVEMGILLDVLVGVMITGLLMFRIKKSFEHIDITQLSSLGD